MISYLRRFDTIGETSTQRTCAFHPTEYKELTRLRLNSPTVSRSPKAHENCGYGHREIGLGVMEI
jgi:hypothetical protein